MESFKKEFWDNLIVYVFVAGLFISLAAAAFDGALTWDDLFFAGLVFTAILALWLVVYSLRFLHDIWKGKR